MFKGSIPALITPFDQSGNVDEDAFARFVISVNETEVAAIRKGMRAVGYEPGAKPGLIARAAVEKFQGDFALTVDGLIGRATLSTLQREIDARSAVKKGGGAAVGGGAVATGNEALAPAGPIDAPAAPVDIIGDPLVSWGGMAVGAVALLFLAWAAWHYRDVIAVRVQNVAPRLATRLRSF